MKDNLEEMLFLSQMLSKIKPVNLLQQLFTGSIAPIVVTDAGHLSGGYKIVYANDAFCRTTGYSLAELVGRSPKIFQGENSNHAVLEQLGKDLKEKGHFRGISRNYKRDGTCYPLAWDISPIHDDDGKIVLFVSVQRELTDLVERSKNIKDVNEKVRQFIQDVSSGNVAAKEIKSQTRGLVQDLKDNAKLYTAPLHDESSDDMDSFFDIDAESCAQELSNHQDKTPVSAAEYLKQERLSDGELQSLKETLEDVEEELECLVADASAVFHLDVIESKLRQLSDDIFFLVEFTDTALAIADVADNISKATPEQLAAFLLDIMKTLVEEVDNWLTSVFITKTASNIYEGSGMIISSAKQIDSMLKLG